MRFFSLCIMLLAACAGMSAGARAVAPPRPVVVLVHGRGQFGRDTASLRREWQADLDSSLRLVGMPALHPGDVRLAWYADALDPDSSYECGARLSSIDAGAAELRDIASGFLNFLASAAGEDARELRGMVGETMYVLDHRTRCAAEQRVGRVIRSAAREGRPVVVVAYSLGSLVTYGFLLREDSLTGVQLVTIGSPLALRPVRDIIFGDSGSGELRVPRSVTSWGNVYDGADVLAGPLSGQVPVGRVRDRPTHAGSAEEAHVISRYLRDAAMGAALRDAICAASPGLPSCAASRTD